MKEPKEDVVDSGAAAVLGISSVFMDAWATMVLWNWFVYPVAQSRIGYWQAMGMSLLVMVVTHRAGIAREGSSLTRAAEAFVVPILGLVIGAIIHGAVH